MPMTTRYTVIDGEVIAEKRNGIRKQYVPDPLGSTVALLDNTQTQTDTFSYWPYGEVASRTGSTPTPFQFVGAAGYRQDSASKIYVRARVLHSQLGRWATEDPLGFDAGTANLYLYVNNKPADFIDPSGLIVCCRLICNIAGPDPACGQVYPGTNRGQTIWGWGCGDDRGQAIRMALTSADVRMNLWNISIGQKIGHNPHCYKRHCDKDHALCQNRPFPGGPKPIPIPIPVFNPQHFWEACKNVKLPSFPKFELPKLPRLPSFPQFPVPVGVTPMLPIIVLPCGPIFGRPCPNAPNTLA